MNDFLLYKEKRTLAHYGVNGQRWGFRRYQNPDGTLTDAGRKHYKFNDEQVKAYNYEHKDVNSMSATERKDASAYLREKQNLLNQRTNIQDMLNTTTKKPDDVKFVPKEPGKRLLANALKTGIASGVVGMFGAAGKAAGTKIMTQLIEKAMAKKAQKQAG